MTTLFEKLYRSTPLQGANAAYVEALYEAYLEDPASVPLVWRRYFETLGGERSDVAHGPIVRAVADRVRTQPARGTRVQNGAPVGGEASEKQAAVSRLIQAYSLRGHQIADLDPLRLWQRPTPAVLTLGFLGLDDGDLDHEFYVSGAGGKGSRRMQLRDIITLLKRIYCGKLAAEFAHISLASERVWVRERFERSMAHEGVSAEERRAILASLTRAEGIERYLNTRYVGQKRFSLEGGETLIPMLDDLIQRAGVAGVQELAIGMAHRGRLNVLVNVLGKSPRELFSEFEGAYDLTRLRGSGDVKYHMGFSGRHSHAARSRPRHARVQSFASRDRQSRRRGFGPRAPGPPRRRGRQPRATRAHPR